MKSVTNEQVPDHGKRLKHDEVGQGGEQRLPRDKQEQHGTQVQAGDKVLADNRALVDDRRWLCALSGEC